MCSPSSSMRAASSTTGPRTSYRTLSSFEDFLNSRMVPLPCVSGPFAPSSSAGRRSPASGCTSSAAGGCGHTPPPMSHSSPTPNSCARKRSVSARGTVLPATYWLMWLFPSFTPWASAARTRSTCLRSRRAIASLRRAANASFAMTHLPVASPAGFEPPRRRRLSSISCVELCASSTLVQLLENGFELIRKYSTAGSPKLNHRDRGRSPSPEKPCNGACRRRPERDGAAGTARRRPRSPHPPVFLRPQSGAYVLPTGPSPP